MKALLDIGVSAKLFIPVVVIALISSCTTFKSAEVDPNTGQFESFSVVSDDEIKVYKPLAGVKTLPFVYLRTASKDYSGEFEAVVRDSVGKMGFPRVVSEYELAKLVIARGLTGDVPSLRSPLSLHRLSQAIGPFLVADFRVGRLSDIRIGFDVVIIDPVSADIVFEASRRKVAWADFDKEIIYPMMNAVKRWFDESAKLPAPDRIAPVPGTGT